MFQSDQSVQVAYFKGYSNKTGYFELKDIVYDNRKNTLKYFDPLILLRGKDNSKYSILKQDYVYEKKDIEDMLVISKEVVNRGEDFNAFNINIHLNGNLIKIIESTATYNTLPNIENKIIYSKQKRRKKFPYEFYLYDYISDTTEELGKHYDFHLSSRQWLNSKGNPKGSKIYKIIQDTPDSKVQLLDDNYVYFYFSYDGGVGSVVTLEFSKSADILTEMENLSEIDVTKNYKVGFLKDRINDMNFMIYLIKKYTLPGLKLFAFEIEDIINVIDFGSILYKYHAINRYSNYQELRSLYEHLSKKYNKNDEEMIKLFAFEYGEHFIDSLESRMQPYVRISEDFSQIREYGYTNTLQHPSGITRELKEKYEMKIQSLHKNALLNNDESVRWISEFSLFRLANMHFPDALFQYRTKWLDAQSLDIFIPSINIAIEYQGEQHYRAINFFGGKEALKKNKERDRRKRKLCNENNVKLIEWKYNLPINIINLTEILKKNNIDFENILL